VDGLRKLSVLITNIWLREFAGTETYVRELALELKKRGHLPMVYSPQISPAWRALVPGVAAVDDLGQLPAKPDIIHGHHNAPVAAAAAFFPEVPVIFVSHSAADFLAEYERPVVSPRIARYVAVDECVKASLLETAGAPREKIRVIYTFVDTARFAPRPAPLPPQPQKALVFSNYTFQDEEKQACIRQVRTACGRCGVTLDVLGMGTANYTPHPETVLVKYDLVFAKDKCALEALAVGCAVILCDGLFGAGEMVTPENFDHCRRFNFGKHLLSRPAEAEALLREIAKYDPRAAARAGKRARKECSLTSAVDELTALYRQVLRGQ
jgi:hypothetical protein